MNCSKCGLNIENANTAFCPNCGTSIEQNSTNNNEDASQQNPQKNTTYNAIDQKSKMAAGLLGIFLGGYGVHNFYLGYKTKAIIQLSITLGCIILAFISCGILGFVTIPIAFGMGIWGLIEGIMILSGSINVDGNGNTLKD